MRARSFVLVAGLLASGLFATRTWSSMSDFDVTGTWAAGGQSCSDAEVLVEFDGRRITGIRSKDVKAAFADEYSAALNGGGLVVDLTRAASSDRDQWRFLVDGRDAMRLDNEFLADRATGAPRLMKFTRCATPA